MTASGPDSHAVFSFSANGKTLTARGFCLGKIAEADEPSQGAVNEDHINETLRFAWTAGLILRWRKLWHDITTNEAAHQEAFVHTLTAGWFGSGRFDKDSEVANISHRLRLL